jgi:hypothetical protein
VTGDRLGKSSAIQSATSIVTYPQAIREDRFVKGGQGRFAYLLVGTSEPRLGRRTALTLPLFPPPQKN